VKRCPQCHRDYSDETLNYCLDDGERLLDGPIVEDAKTESLPSFEFPHEAATRVQEAATSQKFESASISRENIFAAAKGHKTVFLIITSIVLVVLAGFVYGIYNLVRDRERSAEKPAVAYKIQALTASGNIREAAISPDGKFLAYTENANGKAGVWVKQIATNSNVPIVEPTEKDFNFLKFSPDGLYVYFGLIEKGYSATVYRVPTLSGAVVTVIGDAEGPITFSPDGKQFAFERYDPISTESALMIANADGSGERKLASRSGHEFFSSTSLAWSPDGKLISCAASDDQQEPNHALATVDVATGELKIFGKRRLDRLGHSVWLPDQTAILFAASDSGANIPSQIWQVSYPDGEVRQLTNDLTGYLYLTVTSDAKELVAVQRETFASVMFSASGDIVKAENISHGKHEGSAGMTLTPDGRVVYVSNISGATEIWIMNSDGSSPRQLTNDGISKYTPAVSGDGRYIVFVSEKGGEHIWRMNLDGSQLMQLTNGTNDANPRCSPDGKWAVFDSFTSGKQLMYRIPISGGDPHVLTDFPAFEADVSPDGKWIAIFYNDPTPEKPFRLGIISFEGGAITRSFDVPQTVAIDNSPQWTPDGKGITYIDGTADRSNLWVQPVDGSPRKQITDFKQAYIYRREWTRDGKQVAIVKGTDTSDAVLITNFR
jgi:Tol biopolymer transport system component